jgi:TetR/AcrR family transcriptional regulator, regulator of cefoperazone and chloramphenicol sensitivity
MRGNPKTSTLAPPQKTAVSPVACTAPAEAKRLRPGGVEARRQLLMTALRLFSEKGYAKTSTRAIAEAAGVNIASISYYFGDKASLYRAVFNEPLGSPEHDIALFDRADLTLRQALEGFIHGFLEPMKQGELVQQCMRLHFREMLEPTGVWAEEIDKGIKPAHAALLTMLGRHLGVAQADDDLHRLTFAIAGLAIHLYMTRDVVEAIRPQLLGGPESIDLWAERMVNQAEAMVRIEAERREQAKK